MRASLKKPKSKAPTILQQESTKLKQKLQLLRQQVTQKKQQKQMNKTATSLQSNAKPFSLNQQQNKLLSQTTKVNMSKLLDSKLHNFLVQVKMESLEEKLKEKGIKTFERLLQLSEEEVDEWKDIAVGWRIKLKKSIRTCRQKRQSNGLVQSGNESSSNTAQNSIITNNRQPNTEQVNEVKQQQVRQKNIEDIIKQRKQEQKFVPMCRQIEQLNEEEQGQGQMTEQDQDVIIQSFMKVFQPRKGIIDKHSKVMMKQKGLRISRQKKVTWSRSVEQLQRQFMQKNHKTYPKEAIVKEAFAKLNEQRMTSCQSLPEDRQQAVMKYCWKCFRKIDIRQNIVFRVSKQSEDGCLKYFCTERCQTLYSEELNQFGHKLEVQQEGSCQKVQWSGRLINEHQQQDDLQTVDLQIL